MTARQARLIYEGGVGLDYRTHLPILHHMNPKVYNFLFSDGWNKPTVIRTIKLLEKALRDHCFWLMLVNSQRLPPVLEY